MISTQKQDILFPQSEFVNNGVGVPLWGCGQNLGLLRR